LCSALKSRKDRRLEPPPRRGGIAQKTGFKGGSNVVRKSAFSVYVGPKPQAAAQKKKTLKRRGDAANTATFARRRGETPPAFESPDSRLTCGILQSVTGTMADQQTGIGSRREAGDRPDQRAGRNPAARSSYPGRTRHESDGRPSPRKATRSCWSTTRRRRCSLLELGVAQGGAGRFLERPKYNGCSTTEFLRRFSRSRESHYTAGRASRSSPASTWVVEGKGGQDFYLLGSDYIGRALEQDSAQAHREKTLKVVGEEYFPARPTPSSIVVNRASGPARRDLRDHRRRLNSPSTSR